MTQVNEASPGALTGEAAWEPEWATVQPDEAGTVGRWVQEGTPRPLGRPAAPPKAPARRRRPLRVAE